MADVSLHPFPSTTYLLLPRLNQNQEYLRLNRRRHRNILPTHISPAASAPLRICKSRFRDSNAESYNTHNSNRKENEIEVEANDDDFDEVFEDFIDSIWIFKVFGSYGWMFPPILLSILLATGLKAFLLALALPLWQSTFTFALKRMQNRGNNAPKLKTKKRISSEYRSRNVKLEEETEWINRTTKEKEEYQSQVSNTDFSDNNSDKSTIEFGGWDELDTGMKSNARSSRRVPRKTSGFRRRRKVRRRWRKNDAPLLLRFLIYFFPFFEFME